jgi:hypothetical protein
MEIYSSISAALLILQRLPRQVFPGMQANINLFFSIPKPGFIKKNKDIKTEV